MTTKSFAVPSPTEPLEYYEFERREVTDNDIEIDIHFCGVCHSDIHTGRGDWGKVQYPCVPGHEIVGVVVKIGSNVSEFAVGDRVGVGCMVNSCKNCDACSRGYENSCRKGPTWTYSAVDPIDGSDTKGGYSSSIVVDQHFVLPIPDEIDLAHAAPLLCAGITTYSPLRHWKIGPQTKVAIIGLGGLGHMGIKYAKSMGAEVWAVTSSPEKVEAANSYGVDGVIVSSSIEDMSSKAHYFDFLLDTIPKGHDLAPYISLLDIHGTICLVGPIEPMPGYHSGLVINGQRSIAGSGIGGIAETQEMLVYSAENKIFPEIELIDISEINKAWDALTSKQSAKRFVIDIKNSF